MACRAFIWAQMFTNVTKHYTPLCGHIKYFDQIKIEFLNKSAYPTAFAVLLYGTKELLLEVKNTGKAEFFSSISRVERFVNARCIECSNIRVVCCII